MAGATDAANRVKSLLSQATEIVEETFPEMKPEPVLVAAVLQALVVYHPRPAFVPRDDP